MNLIEANEKKFSIYYNFLIEENKKYNLTAITEKKEVYIKHFSDSLLMSETFDLNKNLSVCDVGSGAGFPGIPLKICFPNISLTIIEPTQKRVRFLQELCEKLQLDVEIICARVEDISKEYEESFDIVTARAVAGTNILLELLVKICKINGKLVLYKGNKALEEIETAKNAVKQLSLTIDSVNNYDLDDGYGKRYLIVLNKDNKTNEKYPRRYAEILRKPL